MTLDIEVSGLVKRFGSKRAVDGVEWSVTTGVVGLLGPNGAGKTTLLRILATVLAPDAGTIRLCGLDPSRASERLAIRRQLGYLPQQAGLYQGFTPFELVDYVAVLKEMTDRARRRDETRRVLDAVGLTDDMHRKIRTLSGGMRQRVGLAAALLGRPHLLVLDEPAAGLDPDQRLRLRSVLSSAGQTGTVVLSTHQTEEVAAFCGHVVVLLDGRIRFDGTPADLAAVADGRVWVDDDSHPDSLRSWITSDGAVRNIGRPPDGVQLVEPTVDDGYLLLASTDGASA